MNKHSHKVIFNKTTGRMDVVSEIVSAHGQSIGGTDGVQIAGSDSNHLPQFLFKPLAFALMLVLGTVHILPAQAQIIADPRAPQTQQPTILPTASGATQINIQTPSAAGVSMNQYTQFDTQTNGTVLNNSRTNTNTQTAGWVQGNPWLATGSAQIIVNQVNSSNPTHLTGNIEIAGQKADMVIANPSGININGAAIINANRSTFTTGNPQINNGALTGFAVNQGQINIDGAGLNAQGSDYTDILARAVKINAGIWANNLAISAGVNNINANNSQVTANTSNSTNAATAPSIAIDTSALGGMYAGKITLVGTEQGVGVNNAGQIAASAGNVSIDVNGMLTNSGTINSNNSNSSGQYNYNATQIKATSLANTGTISSQGDTQIQTTGLTTNSATIAAGRELKLNAADIDNSTGTINGQRIDISAGSLNNTQGKIQQTGAQALALNAGSINNSNNGLIGYEPLNSGSGSGTGTGSSTGSSSGADTTTTAAGGGSSTVVQPTPVALADGQINIQNSINNNAGQITANGGINLTATNGLENHATLNLNALKVTGDTLDNSSGVISTTQTDVSVNTVNNAAGQIQTSDNSNISANQIDNRTGLIRSGFANNLTASSIDNSNTQGTDQGIEAGSVSIHTNQLTNTTGAVRGTSDLTVRSMGAANDHIDNTQGLMSSNGTLSITDNNTNTLSVTNTAGQIISDGNSSLQVKSLTGDGTVTSNADLTIALADDFNNAGTTNAVNNLSVSTAGNLTNTSALKAGNSTTLSAQNIDNLVNAEISSASTQLTATNTIANRGLIDGGDTIVKAATVNNIGTGRIYGDHIAIGANTLNNLDETVNGTNTAATIAARSQLDIGAQTINNREHSTLFADGALNIGGSLDSNNLATGQAATLNNASATIESTGNMSLSAGQINNTNEHFTSEIQVVKQERVSEVQGFIAGEASPTPLNPSAVYEVDSAQMATLPNLGSDVSPDYLLNAEYGVLVHNDQSNHLITPEGLYGNWNLKDYTRTTSESVVTSTDPAKIIAGGNLTLTSNQLLNDNSQVIVGGDLLGDVGSVINKETLGQRIIQDVGTTNDFWRAHKKHRDSTGVSSAVYDVTHPIQTINISTASLQQNTASTPSTDVGARDTGNLTVNTNGANQIRTAAVNTNMPNSSLFTVDPNNTDYYIQTDPRFANYRDWLSSDWMLSALNLDPANIHKRLGDGYYEQKLIKEQIAQLTGRRYLGDYNNDDTQYQAIMAAGVTFASQYGLRPGIALTSEQMAHLTSDIVWLVDEEVTLPNGSKVTALVPKVYVAVKQGDIDGSGALISANSIHLNLSGDLNNSGTISGRNVTQITAQNINNQGRINANQLNLQAVNDLNNIGGTLDANTSANIQAGHDINVTSTTSSASSQFGSQTIVNRVAGIYVGDGANGLMGDTPANTLVIQAGNNVNLIAAQIDNAGMGNTVIKATNGDVNLSTVNVANTDTYYRDSRNGHSVSETADVGSNINGVGNVTLVAGHDVNATAANVNSDTGTLAVVAGNDINISTGDATRNTVADSYEKNSGFLSSKQTTIHSDSSSNTAIASNFTGSTVVLNAGHDANITGSNVVSDELTSISANNNVNIVSATNTESSDYSKEVKKSGLTGGLSAGVLSVGYSKSKTTGTEDSQSTTQAASTIASLYGDTTIKAGNQLTIAASDVLAANNLALVGKDVNLEARQDTSMNHVATQSKSSGFSVGVTVNPISAFTQAYQDRHDAINPQTGVANVRSVISGAAAGAKAATTGVVVQAHNESSNTSQNVLTSTARTSNLNAGNNLTIMATDGSINSQGTNMNAEGNALLYATDTINLDVAHNITVTQGTENHSGWNTDNRRTGAILGMFESKKGSEADTTITNTTTGSLLSVGGQAQLLTRDGSINVHGSDVVAEQDVNFSANHDINITSAEQSETYQQASQSNNWGKTFTSLSGSIGYTADKVTGNGGQTSQDGSSVTSLGGNVNMTAGNQLNIAASDVIAAQNLNATAQEINITTSESNVTQTSHEDHKGLGLRFDIAGIAGTAAAAIDNAQTSSEAARDRGNQRLANAEALKGTLAGVAAVQQIYQDMTATSKANQSGQGDAIAIQITISGYHNQSNSQQSQSTPEGSTLAAGNNLNLTATKGDITATDATIKAGNTAALSATQDINLLSAAQITNDHSSSSGNNGGAGIQLGVSGSGDYGFGITGNAAVNHGNGQNNSVIHHETVVQANDVQLTSGRDTTLQGGQVTANNITANVGRNLTITSEQDTASYDAHQDNSSASGYYNIYGGGGGGSGSHSNSNLTSDYQSVNQQSGLFAGDGGFNVNVTGHTQLNGGAIVSAAPAQANQLNTGSLGFTDLQNNSKYDVRTASISISSSGSYVDYLASALSAAAPMALNGGEQHDSTTYATISPANITIGGQAASTEQLAGLNTDGSKAVNPLSPIDIQAMQDKAALANTISESMATAVSIVSTAMQRDEYVKHDAAIKVAEDELKASVTPDQWAAYQQNPSETTLLQYELAEKLATDAAFKEYYSSLSPEKQASFINDSVNSGHGFGTLSNAAAQWHYIQNHYGPGSDFSRAAQALSGLASALVMGNEGQAIANLTQPYLASMIGTYFDNLELQPDGTLSHEYAPIRVLAHAAAGATVAYLSGNNATSGAVGAATGESIAIIVHDQLYGNKPTNELTIAEKENIRAISTLASGLVGAVQGGSFESAATSAAAGYNAAVNNWLHWTSGKPSVKGDAVALFNYYEVQVISGSMQPKDIPISALEEMAKTMKYNGKYLTAEQYRALIAEHALRDAENKDFSFVLDSIPDKASFLSNTVDKTNPAYIFATQGLGALNDDQLKQLANYMETYQSYDPSLGDKFGDSSLGGDSEFNRTIYALLKIGMLRGNGSLNGVSLGGLNPYYALGGNNVTQFIYVNGQVKDRSGNTYVPTQNFEFGEHYTGTELSYQKEGEGSWLGSLFSPADLKAPVKDGQIVKVGDSWGIVWMDPDGKGFSIQQPTQEQINTNNTFANLNSDGQNAMLVIQNSVALSQMSSEDRLEARGIYESIALSASGVTPAVAIAACKQMGYSQGTCNNVGTFALGVNGAAGSVATAIANRGTVVVSPITNQTGDNTNYTIGGVQYQPVNVQDPAADALAIKLNGVASVQIPGKFNNREFDILSSEYIGQSKPANFQLGSSFRAQAMATFEAAIELGKVPYFHFEGPPSPAVIQKLQEYGQRYGVQPVIDITPLFN